MNIGVIVSLSICLTSVFTCISMEQHQAFDPEQEYRRLLGIAKNATTDEEYDKAIEHINKLKGSYTEILSNMPNVKHLRPSEARKIYEEKLRKFKAAKGPQEETEARKTLNDLIKRHPEVKKFREEVLKSMKK